MNDFLTIGWITCRKNPGFRWFADSLKRELRGQPKQRLRVVIVDFHCEERRANMVEALHGIEAVEDYYVVPPKATVWQGPHRLTREDFFAAANATNTAICHAPDGWFAGVDDLSVLMPGWLASVREAMRDNYIVCGAYRKANGLVVEKGELKSFTSISGGDDFRWRYGADGRAVKCDSRFFFGCSFAAPVEALERVNGFPEICDGMGYQDWPVGVMLERNGYELRYDRRMMTCEDAALHHSQPSPRRMDKGVEPHDKSHAVLNLLMGTQSPNDFGEGITRIDVLRHRILNGGTFPIRTEPQHDWFDGQLLSEL